MEILFTVYFGKTPKKLKTPSNEEVQSPFPGIDQNSNIAAPYAGSG